MRACFTFSAFRYYLKIIKEKRKKKETMETLHYKHSYLNFLWAYWFRVFFSHPSCPLNKRVGGHNTIAFCLCLCLCCGRRDSPVQVVSRDAESVCNSQFPGEGAGAQQELCRAPLQPRTELLLLPTEPFLAELHLCV